jgi:hypothetical protein
MQTEIFTEPDQPKIRFHHYRIHKQKIWYGYSSEDPPRLDKIRFICHTREEVESIILSFTGNGWIITTFLINYEGEDGNITDPYFIKYAETD